MRSNPTPQPEQTRAASKYTFPHVVSTFGEQLTLRRVPGRARIVYDYNPPAGIRDKRIIPREAGDVGLPLPDSDRVPEDAITWAEAYLEEQALAKSRLAEKVLAAETTPAGTTLKLVFDEYRKSTEYAGLRPKYAREMAAVMQIAEAVLGSDFKTDAWDQEACDRLVEARGRGLKFDLPDGRRRRFGRAGKTTCRTMMVMLRRIFRWAMGRKHPKKPGTWLLPHDPFARVRMPRKGVARVSILTHDRYLVMLNFADEIDPSGRFRLILADARWSGHRLGAVCQTLRSDLLLTVEEIEEALHRSQCKYVAPDQIRRVAKLYSRHGAIYRRWEVQKQGASGEEEVVQYDRVVPLGPAHRAEIDQYLEHHWDPLGLSLDAPLYPTESDHTQCLYIDLPEKWWAACDALARERGHRLAKLEHTRFHGFRRLRRTELKQAKIHDKDVAFICGWTIHSFPEARASVAMNGLYLGFIPEDLFEAVCAGEGQER
jgi:integrase